MTLGEYWKEYHTVITLLSGGAITYALYKLPKPGKALKVLILVVSLFLLTGLLGVIKFAILSIAVGGYIYGGFLALWIYGLIALAILERTHGWELPTWQIFLVTGIWFPISMLIDVVLKAAFLTRLQLKMLKGSDEGN